MQFSEPINIQQLAFQAFETSRARRRFPRSSSREPTGRQYYPRFLSYDRATNQATFQMLDGLANGSYALHLSGPGGLTDLGGNPLVGNDPSGDYVIPFQVQGPDRGISGNMTDGYTVDSQAGHGVTQDLGVLFPDELQAGVTIIRGPEPGTSPASSSTQDEYVIQLLQNQYYSFTLSGDDLPAEYQVTLTNASGQAIPLLVFERRAGLFRPADRGDLHGHRRRVDRRPVGEHLLPVDDRPGRATGQCTAAGGRPGPLAGRFSWPHHAAAGVAADPRRVPAPGLRLFPPGPERAEYRRERRSGGLDEPGAEPAREGR